MRQVAFNNLISDNPMASFSEALNKRFGGLNNKRVKAGWFPSSQYPGTNEPVAAVALVQEFGDPINHIPPRPFMRPAAERAKKEMGAVVRGVIVNHDSQETLETMGVTMQAMIVDAIVDVTTPELSDRTLAARQARGNSSAKPLNDSGQMMAEVNHEIVDND